MSAPKTVVLGVGNLLWADEGFGPRAAARMAASGEVPDDVEVIDGGTQGIYLLPIVQAARRLLVFDAVDFGREPGQIVVLRDGEIPVFFGQRPLSLHQTAFTDVLAAAGLTGKMPEAVTVVGVQLENIDEWGGDLAPTVAGAMDQAIRIGLDELAAWAAEG
ncbi:MAG TPA: HyaD/HybD family hydrogenase maturation endopeptidase [Sulfuricella sp.]|nr:HyaD/HybD family hydrogenase maturation endopeptidase [Sulfuricella sp.]